MHISTRLVTLALACIAPLAAADTFVVSNASDSGFGSLRQAILEANEIRSSGGNGCPRHRIEFAIPGDGPHTIRPGSPLPQILVPVDLDGYSQPGASPNTLSQGTNAVLRIMLDGSEAGTGASGLILVAGGTPGVCGTKGSIIAGLAIGGFDGAGLRIEANDCPIGYNCSLWDISIYGNFIGTDISGQHAHGNGIGILLGAYAERTRIGDRPADGGGSAEPFAGTRNLISGNRGDGIRIASPLDRGRVIGSVIRGNYIGVDASGTRALGNGGHGISVGPRTATTRIHDNLVSASGGDGIRVLDDTAASIRQNGVGVGLGGEPLGNAGHGIAIGGTAKAGVGGWFRPFLSSRAAIAHNGGAGLWVDGEATVDVTAGYIAGNAGLAIDLAPEGVNPPGAGSSAPNHGIEAPILDSASSVDGIRGRIVSLPNSRLEVYFYDNEACHPSGSGDGGQPLGGGRFLSLTTDSFGEAEFTTSFHLPAGARVTAFARRFAPAPASGSEVSEFSNCLLVAGPDPLFANGFERP